MLIYHGNLFSHSILLVSVSNSLARVRKTVFTVSRWIHWIPSWVHAAKSICQPFLLVALWLPWHVSVTNVSICGDRWTSWCWRLLPSPYFFSTPLKPSSSWIECPCTCQKLPIINSAFGKQSYTIHKCLCVFAKYSSQLVTMIAFIIISLALVNCIFCQSPLPLPPPPPPSPTNDAPFPWENEFPNPPPNVPLPSPDPSGFLPTPFPPINVNSTSNPIGNPATAIYYPGYIWNQQNSNWSAVNSYCNGLHGIARIICQVMPRFFFNVQADAMDQ